MFWIVSTFYCFSIKISCFLWILQWKHVCSILSIFFICYFIPFLPHGQSVSLWLCLHGWCLVKFKWLCHWLQPSQRVQFKIYCKKQLCQQNPLFILHWTDRVKRWAIAVRKQEIHCATLSWLQTLFVVWTSAVILNRNREEFQSSQFCWKEMCCVLSNPTHLWPKSITQNLSKHSWATFCEVLPALQAT